MEIKDYQEGAVRTLNPDLSHEEQVKNMLMGIQGETGEVADMFKKYFYQGHPLDYAEVKEEIGDIFFYLFNLCTSLGFKVSDVLRENNEKLLKRYPDGFDKDKSLNRY